MRDDLLAALRNVGVDNLQVFPAQVRDKTKRQVHDEYVAVNIIGAIACANMDESERMDPDDDGDLIDVDFDSLVIDEERARGALLFRLAESVSAIVVHRRIREAVEKTIPGMTFFGPGEWSG
jgi:hypothetical protein